MTNRDSTVESLAGLGRTAPDDLLDAVLRRTGLADDFAEIDGPIGRAYIAWNTLGVTAYVPVEAVGSPEAFGERHPGPAYVVDAPPEWLARRLDRVNDTGHLGQLPVDLSSISSFRRKVLEKCAEIPVGEIRPYGWIAREIGNPGAVRAVGTALGQNPVPVLIPCHRVVRTDGRIGSYAYGSPMKRRLLEHEGLDPEAIESQARRGIRLVGSDTTRIYCYPTCRNAKRISETHRVEFRSEAEAEVDGYRACKVCRPAARPAA